MGLSYTSVDKMLGTLPAVGSMTTVMSADLFTFAADAEGLVNAKLSRLYTVPVVGGPPVLGTLATDIALYRLLALRLFTQEQLNASPWVDRYKEAMDILDDIAAGEITLVTTAGGVVEGVTTGEPWSNTLDYTPTFAEDAFESSVVDPDKLDAIANRRT